MNALKKNLLFLGSLLLHSKDSKIIFYHDVFDQKQNTDMGTPLELFKQHLTTVENPDLKLYPKSLRHKNRFRLLSTTASGDYGNAVSSSISKTGNRPFSLPLT